MTSSRPPSPTLTCPTNPTATQRTRRISYDFISTHTKDILARAVQLTSVKPTRLGMTRRTFYHWDEPSSKELLLAADVSDDQPDRNLTSSPNP